MVLAKITIWFLFQILQWNLSNYISVSTTILLQGLDTNLSGYKAALTLYKREVGLQPKKVCHSVFLEYMLLEEFGIKA